MGLYHGCHIGCEEPDSQRDGSGVGGKAGTQTIRLVIRLHREGGEGPEGLVAERQSTCTRLKRRGEPGYPRESLVVLFAAYPRKTFPRPVSSSTVPLSTSSISI